VADFDPSIVSEHVGWLPEQLPLQAENVQPGVGVAVSVTVVPVANDAVQVWPQLTPAGLLETVPLPLVETASANSVGATRANVAVTP
jgi:hypothetical protein